MPTPLNITILYSLTIIKQNIFTCNKVSPKLKGYLTKILLRGVQKIKLCVLRSPHKKVTTAAISVVFAPICGYYSPNTVVVVIWG